MTDIAAPAHRRRPITRAWRRHGRERALPAATPECSWRQAEYCVLDFELTGLNLRHDDIISFGLVLIRDSRIDLRTTQYALVRPRRKSSIPALSLHAVHERDLAEAIPIERCATQLAGALSGRVLVAHAAWIELCMTNRALRSLGWRYSGPVLDTAVLARMAGESPPRIDGTEPGLEALSRNLGLPVHTPHHALGDAMTTAQLMLALATRLEAIAPCVGDLTTPAPARDRAPWLWG